jgi:hypothetical protein
MMCKINFLTTFQEPLWVPSSLVMSQSIKFVVQKAPECHGSEFCGCVQAEY